MTKPSPAANDNELPPDFVQFEVSEVQYDALVNLKHSDVLVLCRLGLATRIGISPFLRVTMEQDLAETLLGQIANAFNRARRTRVKEALLDAAEAIEQALRCSSRH
jgi:hypothetical protein